MRQRDAYELCSRRYFSYGGNNGIILFGVFLRRGLVFQVGFVQHFPVRDLVAVPRFMVMAPFIGKAAPGVPADQPAVVVGQFPVGGIPQLGALGIIPKNLVGIVGVF